MIVKFNSDWDRHNAGEKADIEMTLARRLVGLGVASYDMKPEARTVEKEPEKPVEEKKVEKTVVPKRKYKRREKAVMIEK